MSKLEDKFGSREGKNFIVVKDGRILALADSSMQAIRVARYNDAAIYMNEGLVPNEANLLKDYAQIKADREKWKEFREAKAKGRAQTTPVKVDPKHMPRAASREMGTTKVDPEPEPLTNEEAKRAIGYIEDIKDGRDLRMDDVAYQDYEYLKRKHEKRQEWEERHSQIPQP